jgi:hypothetical protein
MRSTPSGGRVYRKMKATIVTQAATIVIMRRDTAPLPVAG